MEGRLPRDTGRIQSSIGQGEGSEQTTLLTIRPWTSSLQTHEKINFYCLSPLVTGMLICQLVLCHPSFILLNLLHIFIRLSLETVPMNKISFPVKTRIGSSFPLVPGLIHFQRCPWWPHTFLAGYSTLPSKSPARRGNASAWLLLPSTTTPISVPIVSQPLTASHSLPSHCKAARADSKDPWGHQPICTPHLQLQPCLIPTTLSAFPLIWCPSGGLGSDCISLIWNIPCSFSFLSTNFLSTNKPLKRAVRSCGLQGLLTVSPLFWFLTQVLLRPLVLVWGGDITGKMDSAVGGLVMP